MNAADFRALLARWADVMADHRDWLIELDSVVGDSDLGLTMSDGFRAAADAVNSTRRRCRKDGYLAGKAMASAVPSTMGTLMASGLMNAGKTFKGVEQCNAKQEVELFRAYFDGVKSRGKAESGDKNLPGRIVSRHRSTGQRHQQRYRGGRGCAPRGAGGMDCL